MAVQVAVEIQQVDFKDNGRIRGSVERFAGSEAGQPRVDGSIQKRMNGVDPEGRERFVRDVEIGGGESEFPADMGARNDTAPHAEGTPQHPCGIREMAALDGFTDACAGNRISRIADGWNKRKLEVSLAGQKGEGAGAALLSISKSPVSAYEDSLECGDIRAQQVQKCGGRKMCEGRREGDDQAAFQVESAEQVQFVIKGGQQLRGGCGPEHFQRMRIKRQNPGGALMFRGLCQRFFDDLPVPPVNPVEKADGHPDGAAFPFQGRDFSNDFHVAEGSADP